MSVPDEAAGNKGTCPKCGQKLRIPTPPKPTPTPTSKTVLGTLEGAPIQAIPYAAFAAVQMPPPLAPSPNATQNEQSQSSSDSLNALGGQPDEQISLSPGAELLQGLRGKGRWASLLEWRRVPLANTLWPVVLFFFLPWTNISCNDRVLLQQSGFQSCYGGATPTAQLRQMAERNANMKDKQPSVPVAPFIIPFAGFLAISLITGAACILCVVLKLRSASASVNLLALASGVACFMLLVAQMVYGFPLDRQIQKQNERIRQVREIQKNNPLRNPNLQGMDLAADALVSIEAKYAPWIFGALLISFLSLPLLAIEAALFVSIASRRTLLMGGGIGTAACIVSVIGVGATFGLVEFLINKNDGDPFAPPATGKVIFRKEERLTPNDPLFNGRPHRAYTVQFKQGKTYTIDLRSVEMDSFLYLRDPKGMVVAQDDDGGGFPDARIRFTAHEAGNFGIVATCFGQAPAVGANFTLIVREE